MCRSTLLALLAFLQAADRDECIECHLRHRRCVCRYLLRSRHARPRDGAIHGRHNVRTLVGARDIGLPGAGCGLALDFLGRLDYCRGELCADCDGAGDVCAYLTKEAVRRIRERGEEGVWATIELERKGLRQMATVILVRPLRMLFTEAVVGFSCLYLALAYAIFCALDLPILAFRRELKMDNTDLFFEAYPIIFQGIYSMSPGLAGLTFLPIGIGACIACALFLTYDVKLQRAKLRHAPWAAIEEYRRLPLACLGGPCIVISLFWLGWTSSLGTHWIVPTIAGIPFGVGYLLIFMALLNYLTDAYADFAASAMAASTCSRCLGGALLPFAAISMYERLGVAWASSLLGFLSLGMCAIPFVFIRYGDKIRARSTLCLELALLNDRKSLGEREGGVEGAEGRLERV